MADGANRKVRIEGRTYTAQEVADFLHVPVRHVCTVLDKIKLGPITPTWAVFARPKTQQQS